MTDREPSEDWPFGGDSGDPLFDLGSSGAQEDARPIRPAAGNRPTIQVQKGELHKIATEAEAALIRAETQFFARGGQLVRPIVDHGKTRKGFDTQLVRITRVGLDTMVDHMSRSAAWSKFDGRRKALVPIDPPKDVASIVLARDGEWRFPTICGVISTQTLRPNGSLLAAPGYDAATRLLLHNPPPIPRIETSPTRDDAQGALDLLDSLLGEFPFVDAASRSVALSALITPVVRGAMPVAPLHAMTAPAAGTGKSYIVDIASAIATGDLPDSLAVAAKDEETEKRLDGALLDGRSIISIDNVNGDLGGDKLCQLVERPVVAVRRLGGSDVLRVESRATVFANGNNLRLVADMTRRTILCSLDAKMERPEDREFTQDPVGRVLSNRGDYVAAAITVVRAYFAAGRPNRLRPLPSFEAWSDTVRSALVWLGKADPLETMAKVRAEDPDRAKLAALFAAWYEARQGSGLKAGDLVAAATDRSGGELIHPELHEALIVIAHDGRGGADARRLGMWLSARRGRIIDGRQLVSEEDSHTKQKLWRLVAVG